MGAEIGRTDRIKEAWKGPQAEEQHKLSPVEGLGWVSSGKSGEHRGR